MEGLTASLAFLERKFYTSKSWFSSYILLLLILVTPEQCCSITISISTVWALLNSCCSLEVFHQNDQWHPVVPVEVQNETLSYIHLEQKSQTANREVIHWLKRSMLIPSNETSGVLFSLFASEDPWKCCFITPGFSLGFGLSASDNLGETPIIRVKDWPEETPGLWIREESTVKIQLTRKESNLASSAWRQWTKSHNADIACLRLEADS